MRPEDIIADVIRRSDLAKSSPDDVAVKVVEALEREKLYLRYPTFGRPCPLCGED